MSELKCLSLRTDYRKGRDDIANDFYLPCMRSARSYDRAVGFFNSAIYVIAWPSLKDFVSRRSRMRLICSPVLPPSDIEAIESGYSDRYSCENADRLRDDIRQMLSTPFLHKPTAVLAALISIGIVDVRIAFMRKTSRHDRLFHDKLGIFHDDYSNSVAFKGSMNETWSGLSSDGNLESIDVFLSWEHERESNRVAENINYFEALWDNKCESDGVIVKPFPDIAKSELLSASDIERWPELVDEICRDIEAAKRFEASQAPESRKLRPHQSAALLAWEQAGRRGILEHATGSGKTFTAMSAIRDGLARHEVPLVIVPSELLLDQWDRELSETLADLSPQILKCGAGNSKWKEGLLGPWTRLGSLKPLIVLSTMQTASSLGFRQAVRQGKHIFLVADEVHRVGSPNHLQILLLETGPRLGLSATPCRAGDPDGTAKIFDYFNGVIAPPFTLQDAIQSGALTPYFYHVHTVALASEEQEIWDDLTKRIRRLSGQVNSSNAPNPTHEDQIKRLLIERSRVMKQAQDKPKKAAEILQTNYRRGDRWIVYCDDLSQLASVQSELAAVNIDSIQYHSAMGGDKGQTIRLFEVNGGIIVSIRCLDEGVDIPSVTHALILASSKNPREYIQRRGRVLRRSDRKLVANIHDVLVLPSAIESSDDEVDPRLNITGGEITRAVEFGRSALNPSAITDLERIALHFSDNYQVLLKSGYEEDE